MARLRFELIAALASILTLASSASAQPFLGFSLPKESSRTGAND